MCGPRAYTRKTTWWEGGPCPSQAPARPRRSARPSAGPRSPLTRPSAGARTLERTRGSERDRAERVKEQGTRLPGTGSRPTAGSFLFSDANVERRDREADGPGEAAARDARSAPAGVVGEAAPAGTRLRKPASRGVPNSERRLPLGSVRRSQAGLWAGLPQSPKGRQRGRRGRSGGARDPWPGRPAPGPQTPAQAPYRR